MKFTDKLDSNGFVIINEVYSAAEIEKMICELENIIATEFDNLTTTKSDDLYAIRKFLIKNPQLLDIIFNANMTELMKLNFANQYFITKSIYFNKPEKSNWFVAYHQDLTIAVDKKIELENYSNWTTKQKQFAVQPPLEILEQNFTIRIHIDSATKDNGALKVLNKSHKNGITRIENIKTKKEQETICKVEKGGIMIMKPLLFHSSSKTTNNKRRRVIHIEFSNQKLAENLEWVEKMNFNIG